MCPICQGVWVPAWHWAAKHYQTSTGLKSWIPIFVTGCEVCQGFSKALICPIDITLGVMGYKGGIMDHRGDIWRFIGHENVRFTDTIIHAHLDAIP